MNQPSTEEQLLYAESPRAVSVARSNGDHLVRQERRELRRANALARHIDALRAQMLDVGRLHSEELQQLQEQHRLHLDRCLRLRSRLLQCRHYEATASAFSASN